MSGAQGDHGADAARGSGNVEDAGATGIRPDSALGHEGELEMRRRFPGRFVWDAAGLNQMMRPVISPSLARFLEAQPFFFIATASAGGHCDASFRGREQDASGNPRPALRVLDEKHLIFPDFSGNGLYNSLGNILTNPHIGMLFVDFTHRRRARVNGLAEVIPADAEVRAIWPLAQAAVRVTVEQAYGNCPARVPRLQMVPDSDAGWD
ncbi:pyridoxamine 5'-phosphate oxidase family protein [Segnochrobactraceae bacterium EtOH-i3]